jgi:hypothetical protein
MGLVRINGSRALRLVDEAGFSGADNLSFAGTTKGMSLKSSLFASAAGSAKTSCLE